MVNMISGGLHAGGQLDIQDVLAIPTGAHSYSQALEQVVAIYLAIGDQVRDTHQRPLVADEGGWAPRLSRNEDALRWVREAIVASRVQAVMAVDIASTHFYTPEGYRLGAEDRLLDTTAMIQTVGDWASRYPLVSFEDPLAEDEWAGWEQLTEAFGSRLQILGDDLFTTNPERLQRGIKQKAANAILVKVNQIGTLSETLEVIQLAKTAGYRTVVSARSGETEDSFLADLAVGTAAGQIKVGSVTRSSRLSKWNQLLRIEEELGTEAYVGISGLGLPRAG
jgi:enolase